MKITQKNEFSGKLLKLVLPIAFQQFMLATVSASDAIMLGWIDQNSLAAVSLAGQIQFIFNLFLAAVTIGASVFAAQYWGKGDKIAIEKVLAIALRVSMVISIIFWIGATFFPKLLMRIFTPDTVLIEGGATYLRVVGVSYIFCGISQTLLCIMKNSGLALKSAIISSTSVVLNIIFNAILIYGLLGAPKMGIVGAAAATVIARLVELLWVLLDSLKKDRIKIRIKYIAHEDKILRRDFWKYTLPVFGNEIVWGFGFSMYTVIMGYLNTDAVSANSVANIVKNLTACVCIGLGNGGSIMIGNALGEGELEKAKEYGNKLCKISIVSGTISGILLLAISPIILRFSNFNEQANTYLKWMLVMCSYYMIGKSINGTTIAGIFCAGGDSKFGLVCDTITLWCITVPLGLIAAFVLKLPTLVVYFIINLDEFIKLPAVYRHYKKYIWVKDLTTKIEHAESFEEANACCESQ